MLDEVMLRVGVSCYRGLSGSSSLALEQSGPLLFPLKSSPS